MANQPSKDKRHITMRVDLKVCRKVEKMYAHVGDKTPSVAFMRALEDAVRDVELTADDYQMIADEARANEKKSKGV